MGTRSCLAAAKLSVIVVVADEVRNEKHGRASTGQSAHGLSARRRFVAAFGLVGQGVRDDTHHVTRALACWNHFFHVVREQHKPHAVVVLDRTKRNERRDLCNDVGFG